MQTANKEFIKKKSKLKYKIYVFVDFQELKKCFNFKNSKKTSIKKNNY